MTLVNQQTITQLTNNMTSLQSLKFSGALVFDGMGSVRLLKANNHYIFDSLSAKSGFFAGEKEVAFSVVEYYGDNSGTTMGDVLADIKESLVEEDNWFIKY